MLRFSQLSSSHVLGIRRNTRRGLLCMVAAAFDFLGKSTGFVQAWLLVQTQTASYVLHVLLQLPAPKQVGSCSRCISLRQMMSDAMRRAFGYGRDAMAQVLA